MYLDKDIDIYWYYKVNTNNSNDDGDSGDDKNTNRVVEMSEKS